MAGHPLAHQDGELTVPTVHDCGQLGACLGGAAYLAGDEQCAERAFHGVAQSMHQGACVALGDAEYLGEFQAVQVVPVGEVEDGPVAVGQSARRLGHQIGEFALGG